MKHLFLAFIAVAAIPNQVFAAWRSGTCPSQSFYKYDVVAKSFGAGSCYFERIKKIENPKSVADRQHNYFADKINEYALVFGPHSINEATLEVIFIREVRQNALSTEDAQDIDFSYEQPYLCSFADGMKSVTSKLFVSRDLRGVCLTSEPIER